MLFCAMLSMIMSILKYSLIKVTIAVIFMEVDLTTTTIQFVYYTIAFESFPLFAVYVDGCCQ